MIPARFRRWTLFLWCLPAIAFITAGAPPQRVGNVVPFPASVGMISTHVGPSFPADGASATTQVFDWLEVVVCDSSGGFYFTSQYRNVVYHVAANGTLGVVAGNGVEGFGGDGGDAKAAQLKVPGGLALDAAGDLFIGDQGNNRIRKVTPGGVISTVAGNGTSGYSGDGGPAIDAQINSPWGMAIDKSGNLFFADAGNKRIRRVTPAGVISTVAGNGRGALGFSGDNGPALEAQISATVVAVNAAGTLFINDAYQRIRAITPDGIISTVAGSGAANFSGDGGPAVTAGTFTNSVAVDDSNNLFIADSAHHRIRKVDAAGVISTVAGNGVRGFSGDGGPAISAQLNDPRSVAVDSAGNIFIADYLNHRIRKVTSAGVISTVAGSEPSGYRGDGGPATSALLNAPQAVAVDASGNLFIADRDNSRIRKLTPGGIISTLVTPRLTMPSGLAVDTRGNIFISDEQSNVIRKVTPQGIASIVAGNSRRGFSGDGGPAISAQLNNVIGLAVNEAGELFIADRDNNRIRKVATTGVITTVAGNGTRGFSGDKGPALLAQLSSPQGVAVDAKENLYIADTWNSCIRKVTPNGTITTIAGPGSVGSLGDGGPAAAAILLSPGGIATDKAGNLYIADTNHGLIRKIDGKGIITTVAGSGDGFGGDGGLATSAQLHLPHGVVVDTAGNLFIADTWNHRIRKVTVAP